MPETAANPSRSHRSGNLTITHLVRPHWKALTIALLAVLGETLTDVLEPWPIKIVVDNLLQSKKLPGWLGGIVAGLFGEHKLAILNFAVAAVAAIAVVGAVSSYVEKYLTTSVSQWVTHDLRRTLYNHIQRLSLAEHDQARTGDLITRVTSDIEAIQDFITSALHGGQRVDARRHDRSHALHQLAVHPDCPFDRAGASPGRVQLHPPHQESLARGAGKTE